MTDDRHLKRTIVKEVVPSRYLMEGQRNLRIFLPAGYNELLSYPVVYCQDGEDFFNFGRVATTASKLILDEDYDPFIIVGIDVDKTHRTAEYAPEGDRHQSYLQFFAEELIPFVEQRYAVRTTPDERLLAGDSLGGTVSLMLALRYPELFTRVLSLSGAFYDTSLAVIEQTDKLDWLSIYMLVGLQETAFDTGTAVYNFVELNRRAHSLLQERQASVVYEEKDGKHQWGFWQLEIPAALRRFIPRGW